MNKRAHSKFVAFISTTVWTNLVFALRLSEAPLSEVAEEPVI